MESRHVPSYAVFDNLYYGQRIAVIVRWFLLAIYLGLINYRINPDNPMLLLDRMGAAVAAVNVYLTWRVWKARRLPRLLPLFTGVMDLTLITGGIFMTTGFQNSFFVLYYPALVGLSLVLLHRAMTFALTAVVAGAYSWLSILTEPGVQFDSAEEKMLIVRVATMFAMVAAVQLMTRTEVTRRREAMDAERAQARRNLDLERKAQKAEQAARQERDRIAREIHDGIAQSIYALNLNLETGAELAEREDGPLRDHLRKLVPLAKKTLLETRHYIHDLRPLLSRESDLIAITQSQVKEFRTVARIEVDLSTDGGPTSVPLPIAEGAYPVLQEALANVLKHAQASSVRVSLAF